MKSSTIHPAFGDKHKEYIRNATRCIISVAEGAVRAGKTIDNIAAFATMINKGTPDRIHLATGSTAANAKLNIGDANGFGLEYLFRGRCRWTKYKGNEALVIKSCGRDYVVILRAERKRTALKKYAATHTECGLQPRSTFTMRIRSRRRSIDSLPQNFDVFLGFKPFVAWTLDLPELHRPIPGTIWSAV